jgi:hypothetical protein
MRDCKEMCEVRISAGESRCHLDDCERRNDDDASQQDSNNSETVKPIPKSWAMRNALLLRYRFCHSMMLPDRFLRGQQMLPVPFTPSCFMFQIANGLEAVAVVALARRSLGVGG